MATYRFLSDEWLAEAARLRDELGVRSQELGDDVINVIVTGGPDGDREAYLANRSFGAGLKEGAAATLTLPYEVAKRQFVDGDQQAAMEAFMAGQIQVDGDLGKLVALQGTPLSPDQLQLAERLRSITVL